MVKNRYTQKDKRTSLCVVPNHVQDIVKLTQCMIDTHFRMPRAEACTCERVCVCACTHSSRKSAPKSSGCFCKKGRCKLPGHKCSHSSFHPFPGSSSVLSVSESQHFNSGSFLHFGFYFQKASKSRQILIKGSCQGFRCMRRQVFEPAMTFLSEAMFQPNRGLCKTGGNLDTSLIPFSGLTSRDQLSP